jgi:predicted RNase H-like HicB family nuclease
LLKTNLTKRSLKTILSLIEYSEKLYAIEHPEIITQGEMLEKFEENMKEAYF